MMPFLSLLPMIGNFFKSKVGMIVGALALVVVGYLVFEYWLDRRDEVVRTEMTRQLELDQRIKADEMRTEYETRVKESRTQEAETVEQLNRENEEDARVYQENRDRINSGTIEGSADKTSDVINESLRSLRRNKE